MSGLLHGCTGLATVTVGGSSDNPNCTSRARAAVSPAVGGVRPRRHPRRSDPRGHCFLQGQAGGQRQRIKNRIRIAIAQR